MYSAGPRQWRSAPRSGPSSSRRSRPAKTPESAATARRRQTCHFRKRTTSAPAERSAYGLGFARHCEFSPELCRCRSGAFAEVARLVPPEELGRVPAAGEASGFWAKPEAAPQHRNLCTCVYTCMCVCAYTCVLYVYTCVCVYVCMCI